MLIVAGILAFLLLSATGPWPYEFYMMLRVFVCTGAIYCAACLWPSQRSLALGCLLFAALFNPFLPAHLTREIWLALNVIGAGFFAYIAYSAARQNSA